MHPHRAEAMRDRSRRTREHADGGAVHDKASLMKRIAGEAVHEHESALHKGARKTKLKLAKGGRAREHEIEGRDMGGRLDKPMRGGSKGRSGKGTTNVIVEASPRPAAAAQAPTRPVPVPVPVRRPPPQMPPSGAAAKPPGAMPPPGGGAPPPVAGMGPGPGMPPPGAMRKRGGRTHEKRV